MLGDPVNFLDVSGLARGQRGGGVGTATIRDVFPQSSLQATQAGALVAAGASAYAGPVGVVPGIVFGGITAGAFGIEIVLYSDFPYIDAMFYGLKKIMPKSHFITDKMIQKYLDYTRDAIKENERNKSNQKMCY